MWMGEEEQLVRRAEGRSVYPINKLRDTEQETQPLKELSLLLYKVTPEVWIHPMATSTSKSIGVYTSVDFSVEVHPDRSQFYYGGRM